jgi:hypothetical protein
LDAKTGGFLWRALEFIFAVPQGIPVISALFWFSPRGLGGGSHEPKHGFGFVSLSRLFGPIARNALFVCVCA